MEKGEYMTEQEFITHCLTKIDMKQNLTEREIRDLLEYEIMKDEGEDRRWSRSIRSLVKLNDRYFVVDWEHGLTENQDNEFMDQPIEVFNHQTEEFKTYRTCFFSKEGKKVASFEHDEVKNFNA